MRPQGYLGRAYAARHAQMLGLPTALNKWSDTHALRALLAHGHDSIGNLLLGDAARDAFLANTGQIAITEVQKPQVYTNRALEAASGDSPGSSAGGEQPKFLAYAETVSGPRHVIVKFTAAEDHAVSQRWRDLLLAEHLALHTLSLRPETLTPRRHALLMPATSAFWKLNALIALRNSVDGPCSA